MTFWYGSGSADPYIGLIDPDPALDRAIFVSDIQDGLLLIEDTVHLHHFSKIKSHKEVTKQ